MQSLCYIQFFYQITMIVLFTGFYKKSYSKPVAGTKDRSDAKQGAAAAPAELSPAGQTRARRRTKASAE
jgi:hypothetical protein